MKDIATGSTLRVRISGFKVPYLIVDVRQVEQVKAFLQSKGYVYELIRNAVTLDGRETDVVFNFGKLSQERLDELKTDIASAP